MIWGSKCSACYGGCGSVWFKLRLFVSVREKKGESNKASSASRLFGPKLSSACWCWNRETSCPLPLYNHTHSYTTWSTTNASTHQEKNPCAFIAYTQSKFVTKSYSQSLAILLTCFISASHLLLSTSLICLCLYQTLSIPISCLWDELSFLAPPLPSSLSCFLAPPYIH